MTLRSLAPTLMALTLAGAGVAGVAPATAQTAAAVSASATASSPAALYTAESKTLSSRYQSDLQICNSEAEAAGRMQCKRDARAQYDQGLADAASRRNASLAAAKATAATSAALAASAAVTARSAPVPVCADCGKVTTVTREEREGKASPVGAIAGGVVGGLLGNQIGGGTGKDLATIAGAAGGVFAGREVEKRVTRKSVWVVKVEFAAGGSGNYEFAQDPGYKVGDAVKKSGNSISR